MFGNLEFAALAILYETLLLCTSTSYIYLYYFLLLGSMRQFRKYTKSFNFEPHIIFHSVYSVQLDSTRLLLYTFATKYKILIRGLVERYIFLILKGFLLYDDATDTEEITITIYIYLYI